MLDKSLPDIDFEEAFKNATVRVVTLVIAFDREGADSNCISAYEYIKLQPNFDGKIIGWAERDVLLNVDARL